MALTGALALAGCGSPEPDSGADLSVGSAYMPQPVSDTAAGFLVVSNKGGTADQLTSASSEAAGHVTVHQDVDGVMREADTLDIPAHGSLVLESGGHHLMFERLKERPKQGQQVSVELRFAHSEPVTVEIPVKPATYIPKHGH